MSKSAFCDNKWDLKSRFRRVSYNADSERGQRERIAKDVSHAELLAPAAISAVVVIHFLAEIWAKARVAGHQVLLCWVRVELSC